MRYANLFEFWFDKRQRICNIYACLILVIQLWGTKTDTVLFLSSLMLEKVDNL